MKGFGRCRVICSFVITIGLVCMCNSYYNWWSVPHLDMPRDFLNRLLTNQTQDKYVVPSIVHYAWYSPTKSTFRFHHFISVLSAYKHIKPERILFWYDRPPIGVWWEKIVKLVPVIELRHREAPTSIYGHVVKVPEHQSDIVRLEAVMKYGGVYTDLDVIVVKSFDALRDYDVTMGYESANSLCNGIILAKPQATFLTMWHGTYRTFNDAMWSQHSVAMPALLAKKHPDLIHTEEWTLNRPNYVEREFLYNDGKFWNWTNNYAVHLWYRFHNKDHTPDDIRTLNTTMGQLFRYIYYGSKELISPINDT